MEAYEGREPYIFISYARVDADKVTPLLEELSSAGYRIWWDKGIKAGEHWTKTLVEKVEGCAVFCPLFSKAFNVSDLCFEETDYAFSEKKTIVPVYLEEMEKKELRALYRLLYVRQNLRLYDYADAAEFVERLGREQAFMPCKAKAPEAFTLCKAKAPEWNKIGQIQWRFSDGVLTIATNEDTVGWYDRGSIPDYQEDILHDCSTSPWMPYREKIFSLEIADDILVIGECAFRGCANLKNVRIGDSVLQIKDCAFEYCRSLTDVRIPDNVTQIGLGVFWHCDSLKSVEIPAGAEVDEEAFEEHTLVIRLDAPEQSQ